jgi:Tfp pilus assembly protein PilN
VSQVNLLPPEIVQRQILRRRTSMIALLGGVVVLAVLVFYFLQTARLSGVEDDIAAQEATNASITSQIAGLQEFATLQATAQAKQNLLASAYANEISFSGLLMDMSRVIPSDAYLDTMTIATTLPDAASAAVTTPSTTPLPTFVGSIQTGGKGLSVETLATYLTRLESVKGWVNPWMNSISKETGTTAYSFTSGVDLTDAVITTRGKEADLAGG